MLRRLLPIFALILLLTPACSLAQETRRVVLATVDGAIMPPTAKYLRRALQRAEREKAECLLVEMNTPGGAVDSTREIAGAFLRARVPVVIFITPAGARAGSAGALVCLSANIVAMAPGTNIGAAHPVTGQGADIQRDMRDKVTSDASALARSLAEKRGRDLKWAEDIVRRSIASTESEALKLKIADLLAESRADLLRKLDGRSIQTSEGAKTVRTANVAVLEEKETWGEGLLNFLYNPNVAIILFALAMYGLIAEFNHPGATLPGVAGAICLVLALFASSVLSVNATGAILLVLAVALFVIDLYTPTNGILSAGGLIAFVVGGLLLFDPGPIGVSVSVPVVLTLAIVTALFFGVLMAAAVRSQKLPPGTGPETLIGMVGEARTDLDPKGKVYVDGALWDAIKTDGDPIRAGDNVTVQAMDGLLLKVRRAQPQPGEPIWSVKTEETTG